MADISAPTKTFGVKVPVELHEALRREAKRRGIKINELVIPALEGLVGGLDDEETAEPVVRPVSRVKAAERSEPDTPESAAEKAKAARAVLDKAVSALGKTPHGSDWQPNPLLSKSHQARKGKK